MIAADGYASESDASAYSEATYGYDADDAYVDDGDTSGDDGNDLTVNEAASKQRRPPTGGILRKKKDLPRKASFLLQIRDDSLPTNQRQSVTRTMERSSVTSHIVQVWQNLSIVLIKFHLHYHHQTEESTLFPRMQASSLLNSRP
jgi:hypothetical protein